MPPTEPSDPGVLVLPIPTKIGKGGRMTVPKPIITHATWFAEGQQVVVLGERRRPEEIVLLKKA